MKTVFISRNLTAESPFLKGLSAVDYKVIGESLLSFSPTNIKAIPDSQWIFFYSQNAVKFSLQHPSLKAAIATRKLAAMGKGTAAFLQKEGREVSYIGTGKAADTAKHFLPLAANQTVLFPRAKNSRRSIQKVLGTAINALDLVVYENVKRTDFNLPICDILVFTSPMNAMAFFEKYSLQLNQKVVAIGETTANSIRALGVEEVYLPKASHELSLCELVQGF